MGSVAWLAAIVGENIQQRGCRINGELNAPCAATRAYVGYNYVFIALPIAVVCVAEVHMMNSVGAWGLTCMFETACVLGIAGYTQIVNVHVLLCVLTGVASILVCLNFGWVYAAVVGVPLVVLSVAFVVVHFGFHPDEDKSRPYTSVSIIYWLFDFWIIMGRNVLLFANTSRDDDAAFDHFWLDIASFASLISLGLVCLWLIWLCPSVALACGWKR